MTTPARRSPGSHEPFGLFVAGRDMASLSAAFDRLDHEQVRQLAHRLKSSSANLGAVHLVSLYEEMENTARAQALTAHHQDLLRAIGNEYQRVTAALDTECRRVA